MRLRRGRGWAVGRREGTAPARVRLHGGRGPARAPRQLRRWRDVSCMHKCSCTKAGEGRMRAVTLPQRAAQAQMQSQRGLGAGEGPRAAVVLQGDRTGAGTGSRGHPIAALRPTLPLTTVSLTRVLHEVSHCSLVPTQMLERQGRNKPLALLGFVRDSPPVSRSQTGNTSPPWQEVLPQSARLACQQTQSRSPASLRSPAPAG